MPGIIAENHPRKISDSTEKLNHEEEKAMEALFQAVNVICGKIQIVSNLFWDFPTNFDWYANIPILGGVHGLPGHLCAAGKEDAAGGKARHHHKNEQKKNAHDHQNVCVTLGGIHQPFHSGADGSFAFLHRLFHAGPGSRYRQVRNLKSGLEMRTAIPEKKG